LLFMVSFIDSMIQPTLVVAQSTMQRCPEYETLEQFSVPGGGALRGSSSASIHPGDLIATGTPEGVGAVKPGDLVEISNSLIGTLRNPVVAG
jgi:hypothetical protein